MDKIILFVSGVTMILAGYLPPTCGEFVAGGLVLLCIGFAVKQPTVEKG